MGLNRRAGGGGLVRYQFTFPVSHSSDSQSGFKGSVLVVVYRIDLVSQLFILFGNTLMPDNNLSE